MPVTFTAVGNGSVTLLDDIGLSMLTMMGHSSSAPGAILSVDVAPARDRSSAVNDSGQVPPSIDRDDPDADEPRASFRYRALPLIDLLAAAAVSQSDVMWH